MTLFKAPRAPAGLEAAGRRLWRTVLGELELRPDELAALEHACRLTDTAAQLEQTLEDHGSLMIRGSMGQDRLHPAVAELRQTRAAVSAALARIDWPADEDEQRPTDATEDPSPPPLRRGGTARATKAAQARWAKAAREGKHSKNGAAHG